LIGRQRAQGYFSQIRKQDEVPQEADDVPQFGNILILRAIYFADNLGKPYA
jgi:hypothetical protein